MYIFTGSGVCLQTLQCVDYEDELDLLAVSTYHQDQRKATVRLYDNQTGTMFKEVALEEQWIEVCLE